MKKILFGLLMMVLLLAGRQTSPAQAVSATVKLKNFNDDYFGRSKTIEERAGGLMSSFIPSILNSIAEVSDSHTKGSILTPLMKKIPLLRENLPVAKHSRSPFLRDTKHKAINQIDPTNYRPPKNLKKI